MGKAKPAKHTSAELAAKTAASLTNKGGGAAGKTDRLGGKVWQGPVAPVNAKRLRRSLCSASVSISDVRLVCYRLAPMQSTSVMSVPRWFLT